jgi:hypothetical protein
MKDKMIKSGHLSFQDMHKGCIKGQPQTYQQLVDIEELIMAICSQAHMKTLVKTMHSTLKLATMVAWAWVQQWHLKGNPRIKHAKITSILGAMGRWFRV